MITKTDVIISFIIINGKKRWYVVETPESQEKKVLNHLETKGRISQWIAMQEYHILRLGARIYDLKQKGYPIRSEMIYRVDEDGNRTKWKEYWLAPA